MRGVKVAVVAGLVVLAGIALPIIACLSDWEERSFSIDTIEVDATVSADGSMLVTERVTYTFRGADDQPFTVASRDFELGGHPGRIASIEAFENGDRRQTITSRPDLFEWDIAPATSGTRTFDVVYRVDNAVLVWADAAELYWNWIGRTSPAVGEWSATVRVPSGEGDVLAWAHGPLDGVLRIDGDVVRSAADDIPAGQFVDNRIVMAPSRFDVPRRDEPQLEAILAEEDRNAETANRERERAQRLEDLRHTAERFLTVAMVPLVLAAVGAFYWVWRRWGKDPPRPDDIGDYWREVPDDPPAVASALLKWRVVDSDAFSATVMDLARRGHLRIEEVEVPRLLRSSRTGYRFVNTQPSQPDKLAQFERRTLRWIFRKGAESVTQEELVAYAKANQTKATKFWTGFQKDVKDDLERRKYLTRGKGLAFALHGLTVAVLSIVAIVALAVGAIAAGVGGLVAALVLAPLGILHRSRTPAGTRRDTEWRALRRYLRDFSRLDEAPVGHLALWDHYLVAATALGVAEELLAGLRTRFPEAVESGAIAPWYVSSAGLSHSQGFASFGQSFGRTSVSSFTPASSGSGSGGGFSSGGGGGGGGGGFGAR